MFGAAQENYNNTKTNKQTTLQIQSFLCSFLKANEIEKKERQRISTFGIALKRVVI